MGRSKSLLAAVAILAGLAAVPAPSTAQTGPPPSPVVVDVDRITAPAGSTEIGRAFDMDEHRLVASAGTAAGPVVHVFDLVGTDWVLSDTIVAPPGATSGWGNDVAVSGETVAVSDPYAVTPNENYGTVHIYGLSAGGWQPIQQIRTIGDFNSFASRIWLGGDGLVVVDSGYCDSTCSSGNTFLYHRGPGGLYLHVSSNWLSTGRGVSVGVDGGELVAGHPGYTDMDNSQERDSLLLAWDSTTEPPVTTTFETVPWTLDWEAPEPVWTADWFRRVDIGGGVIVTENCCTAVQELHVRRRTGAQGSALEAVLPIEGPSGAVVSLPDVVLRLDVATGRFLSHVRHDGSWVAGGDVVVPGGGAQCPRFAPCRAVGAGDRVVVMSADGALTVLTVVAGPVTCFGREVTVHLGNGEVPTSGDDVILGTHGPDDVTALDGNDTICPGSGDDLVRGGPGGDLVDAGDGHDTVLGGAGGDMVTGGAGDDLIEGGDEGDILVGAGGDDDLGGGTGDDWLVGSDGADQVLGGDGADLVHAGSGDDLIRGGPGDDSLFGEAGIDRFWGGTGTDGCHGGTEIDVHVVGCEATTDIP